MPNIVPGLRGARTMRVGAEQAIWLRSPATGDAQGAAVLSTPALILQLELAAKELLEPFLGPDEQSVGMRVAVEHLGATPLGAEIRAEAVVTAVEGRQIEFEVVAHDPWETIARGTHRRAVVRLQRVRDRLREKELSMSSGPDPSTAADASASGTVEQLPPLSRLRVSFAGPVATVVLHRPDKLNCVDSTMTSELETLNRFLAARPVVRVVVLTGAGRAFCSGDDVREVGELSLDDARELSLRQARLYLEWERLPQVFIAAINGPAMGAGCVAAAACDFRIATSGATLGMPEISLGWAPGYGVAQLTSIIGRGAALDLCLTGRTLSAREAESLGLVQRVVPAARLLDAAGELARTLLEKSPAALRETKRLVHADEGLRPQLTHLDDTAAYIRCLATPEARAGIRAFLERRK